ncbi:MAG: LysR family transcriptional regulator, partial [Alphaproteobacteria bacterium]|nr:LysR family transcriptional regulator [Alphaproteobacteria bacterium]
MDAEAGLELTHSFLAVAEELSFRRSAERLNVDQSALSRRIQKLEHLLGFALFERTTREVALTPAGRSFYEQNVRLMQTYSNSVKAARLVAEGKTGSLRVAYMAFAATELMPFAVSRYRRLYPHIDVSLRYIRTQGQKVALAHDEVDIGYMIGPFDHSDFHSLLLSEDPLYVVTPRNHRLTRLHEVHPRDLAEEELILGDMIEWVGRSNDGEVVEVNADRREAKTAFGAIHKAGVLNVVPPQQAGAIAALAGVTDKSGWVPVNPMTFEAREAKGIYVVGDATIAAPM